MHCTLGMFAHYAHWILPFSNEIHPLTIVSKFSLFSIADKAFKELKRDMVKAVITTPNHTLPLVVDTDALECTIVTSLR